MSSSHNDEMRRQYAFQLPPDEEAAFLQKTDKVKLGDSIDRVKAMLGMPMEDRELVGKTGEFNSRLLRYYIRRVDLNLANEHDRFVSYYFNQVGTLTNIRRHLQQ